MAPTRMKLRVRRRDSAAAGGGGGAPEEEEEEAVRGRRRESSRRKNKATPPAAAAIPEALAAAAAEETSPDSKCPICLDRFDNVAFLDRCLHRFCFPCIQEWSHSKAECPLCKQPFASILHSVRAEDDFKEYTLRPRPAGGGVAATVAMVAAMATVARSSHQMRLTLRRHRAADGGETTTAAARRRGRERGRARRAEDGGAGVWEWYLDSPPLPHRPAAVMDESVVRPEAPSEERGVIFEGLAGLEGVETPVAPGDRASRRLMTRLAARRRLQREGGTPRRLREREALALRRALYRCGVRVRGVAGATGDSAQQQRDVSADGFRRSPALLNRLRPWLRRELTVLYGAHGSLVEIVQRIITVRLARHGLEDLPAIEDELRPFLLARTEHFLHELASFARSPLGMDSYDLQAVYEPPPAADDLDWISSLSDSSSVIAISEEDEDEAGGAEGAGLAEAAAPNEDGCLSMSGWDDETPGPSYSSATADQSCSLTPPVGSPAPPEAGEKAAEEEECQIVGYKKPIAERTPELVQLSSDTEEERQEAEPHPPEATPVPPEAPPLPLLPTIPPSTSAASREEEPPREPGVGEEAGPRAHSWSESSRNSACTLSPTTPPSAGGGSKRRRETAGWKEKRRKRRVKKRRRGMVYSPNRSLFPAMARRHRRSSGESSSPPSPAPSSSWEVSTLSSSDSSSSSSSPLSFSPPPPQTPPPPAGFHGEKPGGKRKYKSRHLDSDTKDPTWRPRRRRRGRDGGDRRRTREERSPSVEIIYEGTVAPGDANLSANKRRRRRRHRTQRSSSPVIITLDSDSSDGGSPPLNLSLLPPLPLMPLARVGGALEAQIGELPVDFLDRRSDGSEAELEGRHRVVRLIPSDGSEHDVDVENVDASAREGIGDRSLGVQGPTGAAGDHRDGTGPGSEEDRPKPEVSDRTPPSAAPSAAMFPPLSFDRCSPESRAQRYRNPCEVSLAPQPADRWFPQRGPDPPAGRAALDSDTPPEDHVQQGEGVVPPGRDVPPLLRQASPVRSYGRNTPPPLKHKDAGSPACSPLVLVQPPDDKVSAPSFRARQSCSPQSPESGSLCQTSTGSRNQTRSPSDVRSPPHPPLDLHPEGLGAADGPPSVCTGLVLPAEVNHASSPSPPAALSTHRDLHLERPPRLEPHPLPL